MNKRGFATVLMFVTWFSFAASCVASGSESHNRSITFSVKSKAEPFTQFELDQINRKIAGELSKSLNNGSSSVFCCWLSIRDTKMLIDVTEHFEATLSIDIENYGINIQESESLYYIIFEERYKIENQYKERDAWWPGTSKEELPTYGYKVDRTTLRILDFTELPR